MDQVNIDEVRKAALIMNQYLDNYALKTGGESWWVDHNGVTHTDDVGYFIEMWDHILGALGLEEL